MDNGQIQLEKIVDDALSNVREQVLTLSIEQSNEIARREYLYGAETTEELTSTQEQLHEERQLTQFLGLALRQVLPFAVNEVDSMYDDAKADGEEVFADIAEQGSRSVHRARTALQRLDASALSVKDLEDDHFDDEFQIKFD